MNKIRVLLVDDEHEFTQVLAERMEARGLTVDTSDNGLEAITKAQQYRFDAVILDLAMPGLDGIETLKLLLEQNPDLQVILLTGHATLQKGIEAMKSGAVEFLEKPIDMDMLMAKISTAGKNTRNLAEKRMTDFVDDILKSKGW